MEIRKDLLDLKGAHSSDDIKHLNAVLEVARMNREKGRGDVSCIGLIDLSLLLQLGAKTKRSRYSGCRYYIYLEYDNSTFLYISSVMESIEKDDEATKLIS